ncbi:MAG TPA: Gfo/Idh/MocA family oxidoreductase [Acidimicrobiales bacterium]|nr:Gfo/Idh/MocA family oxidoreductase [Acidimicrobiales bacterium]
MGGEPRPLRVGIVGCGLVGRKRAAALEPGALVASHDIDAESSARLAAEFGGQACLTLDELLSLRPDVVVVATVHDQLAAIASRALRAGAHVLVEKPGGIGVAEIDQVAATARAADRLVKVGFNHRFYPGIARAIREAGSGAYGDVLYLRAWYGHGGRPGYEREWRADPRRSGGGEIVDQGMHLLDLSYWLLGDLPLHSALLRTQFWRAPVDDNAVLVLGLPGGVGDNSPFALFHVSWTDWKNTFALEIACHDAKFAVDGLVRSYGPQVLRIFRMRPELGPPDLEIERYPDTDVSWELEWRHFAAAIAANDGRDLLGDLASARYAWSCLEAARHE